MKPPRTEGPVFIPKHSLSDCPFAAWYSQPCLGWKECDQSESSWSRRNRLVGEEIVIVAVSPAMGQWFGPGPPKALWRQMEFPNALGQEYRCKLSFCAKGLTPRWRLDSSEFLLRCWRQTWQMNGLLAEGRDVGKSEKRRMQ